jgi:chromosome segregation ATPase
MASLEDLESRVTELERQVAGVRQDAAAARILAGAADRDVSEFRAELRAHTSTLNALRETQLEHHAETRERFVGLEGKANGLEDKVNGLEDKVNEGFAKTAVGMAQITALLQSLTDKT